MKARIRPKLVIEQLHEYLQFRAKKEGKEYDLDPIIFQLGIEKGCTNFFGVTFDEDSIRRDEKNPAAFEEWLMLKQNNKLKAYFDNLQKNIYFVKGSHDSKTKDRILASRNGNNFNKASCYWDFVENLPDGTYYVDNNIE